MSDYTDEQYLSGVDSLFDDGEAEIRSYQRKIVVTRKEHPCMAAEVVNKDPHPIPKGSRVVRESAIVDGTWGTSYACFDCIKVWLNKITVNQ